MPLNAVKHCLLSSVGVGLRPWHVNRNEDSKKYVRRRMNNLSGLHYRERTLRSGQESGCGLPMC